MHNRHARRSRGRHDRTCRSGTRWLCRRRRPCGGSCRDLGLWPGGMLRLRGGGGGGALTQLPTRRFTGPGARIDLAHDAQPLFGLGERREVTHVQPKTFAAFLEAPAHEKSETPELGQVGLRERHRRRRRAQVEHKRPCVERRRRRSPGFRARTGSEVGRCCHNFPAPETLEAAVLGTRGSARRGWELLSLASFSTSVAAPPS